jgi:AbrB family looped-hinge helix DNA binding protein
MDEVTISPKYQVVIPKAIRERLHFRPGQKLVALVKGNSVSLVPVPTLKELRGIARGANLEGYREEEDRY